MANITCRECGKDFAAEKVAEAEGRCPECGFNIQLDRDLARRDAANEKEKKKTPEPEKKAKKLFGFGD